MGQYKKLWLSLIAVLTITFSILGYLGVEVYRQAPPFPEAYVSADGKTVISKDDVLAGQSAWQSTGGMELGSILGISAAGAIPLIQKLERTGVVQPAWAHRKGRGFHYVLKDPVSGGG